MYDTWITPCGFLHSDIHGSMDICSSPWLIAAYRVLHRLPVPRHSPCALFSLTMRYKICCHTLRESFVVVFASTNIVVFYPNLLKSWVIIHYFSHSQLFFVVQFSRCVTGGFVLLFPYQKKRTGGHKWIRTTDLTLIRRAL